MAKIRLSYVDRAAASWRDVTKTHSYPQLPTVTHSWKIGYYYSIVNALILPTAAMLLYPQRLYKHPQLPWLLNIDPPNDISLTLGVPTVTLKPTY